jgi:hypothetical protein
VLDTTLAERQSSLKRAESATEQGELAIKSLEHLQQQQETELQRNRERREVLHSELEIRSADAALVQDLSGLLLKLEEIAEQSKQRNSLIEALNLAKAQEPELRAECERLSAQRKDLVSGQVSLKKRRESLVQSREALLSGQSRSHLASTIESLERRGDSLEKALEVLEAVATQRQEESNVRDRLLAAQQTVDSQDESLRLTKQRTAHFEQRLQLLRDKHEF